MADELTRHEVFHSEAGHYLRSVKVLVETGGVEISCYGIGPRGGFMPGTGCGFTAAEWAEINHRIDRAAQKDGERCEHTEGRRLRAGESERRCTRQLNHDGEHQFGAWVIKQETS